MKGFGIHCLVQRVKSLHRFDSLSVEPDFWMPNR
jgi:hypothetical protein